MTEAAACIARDRPIALIENGVEVGPVVALHQPRVSDSSPSSMALARCEMDRDQSLGFETMLNLGAAGELPILQSLTSRPEKLVTSSSVTLC